MNRRRHRRPLVLAGMGLALLLATGSAWAADPVALSLVLRGHRFVPDELRAPAGVPIEITLRNEDPTAEEFESKDLKLEKVVAGGRQIVLRLRPLAPGRYSFFGEYYEATAKGVLIVEGSP